MAWITRSDLAKRGWCSGGRKGKKEAEVNTRSWQRFSGLEVDHIDEFEKHRRHIDIAMKTEVGELECMSGAGNIQGKGMSEPGS